jgi:hypothetical protein
MGKVREKYLKQKTFSIKKFLNTKFVLQIIYANLFKQKSFACIYFVEIQNFV